MVQKSAPLDERGESMVHPNNTVRFVPAASVLFKLS